MTMTMTTEGLKLMRAVVQRVSEASVAVGDWIVGQIGRRSLVPLGVTHRDGEKEARKGRCPGFADAAPPDVAEPLVARFADLPREEGAPVAEGQFQAIMQVRLCNDGPVTLILDTAPMMR